MAVSVISSAAPARASGPASLFSEGFALMRERIVLYLAFAGCCAVAATRGVADPTQFANTLAFRTVMMLALLAIFFILPSALRRIDPTFRMTLSRMVIAAAMIVAIGLVTELGYVALIVPGIVVGVLLSQATLAALLRTSERTSAATLASNFAAGMRTSFRLTKGHFATTLGVLAVSLVILLVPFLIVLVGLIVGIVWDPRSLILTAPLLLLTFIYFECVRYALLVRWYARLARER